jgi:hypothetical protein
MRLTEKSAKLLNAIATAKRPINNAEMLALICWGVPTVVKLPGRASVNGQRGAAARMLTLFEKAGYAEGGHGRPWRITEAGRQALEAFQRKEE